ncbi:MAG TPA: glucan biosynthesis protein G, partial [Pseudoxanthomonas sp.]|nr:glucan biosynthesis protein G [Pseudoxanthomonas sp.]
AFKYDNYRDIRFNPAQSLWRKNTLPFEAQFFHRGFLFPARVDVFAVAAGSATPVVYRASQFTYGPKAAAPRETDLGYAGFRLHAPLNNPAYYDEVCAFLGASYFRAVGKGQNYGLSARGLALNTGSPAGEEFPAFKAFWLETPKPGAESIVVHALMDSPSAAGAFRFQITPGAETVFDVSLRLYPRVTLDQAGIAPLTSMFHFDSNDRVGIDDYRPAVHDSDGLAIFNGAGEQVWRPLHNPAVLQESAFADDDPRGFGLMQRKRDFADYSDSEAHYERRPSLWIEPKGQWGKGAVRLFEIPTADEFHDNIVAFWRPAESLAAGREYRYDYRMHWCARHLWLPSLANVRRTRIGAGPQPGSRLVVIDLDGGALDSLPDDAQVTSEVGASHGKVANVVAHANAGTGGWRVAFELLPGSARSSELRMVLRRPDNSPLSETWLYRWTA